MFFRKKGIARIYELPSNLTSLIDHISEQKYIIIFIISQQKYINIFIISQQKYINIYV